MPGHYFFDPVVSVPLTCGIGVVLTALSLVSYVMFSKGITRAIKAVLLTLRLGVIWIIVVLLLRPMAYESNREIEQKPVFSVITDFSESMNTDDVGSKNDRMTRYQAMQKALFGKKNAFLNKLKVDYDVNFYTFDTDLRSTSESQLASITKAAGKETRIGNALFKISDNDPGKKQAGALLVSDGRETDPGSLSNITNAARLLRSQNIPVWTAAVGTNKQARDVYAVAGLSSNFIYVDQPASIHVSVSGNGYDNWYADIDLYREDEFVTTQKVHLRNGHASLSFPIREERKGSVQYRVEVRPLAGEADERNNKRSVIARIIDDQTRVLVIEARPHWDSKFLLRSLRADSNIELTSIFYINERKSFAIVEKHSDDNVINKDTTPGIRMPRTRDELFKYDCIFLGKDIDTVFTSAELGLLRDYLVERGGSIVFFRGKSYERSSPEIEAVEPVDWGSAMARDVRFELTAVGKGNPIFDYRPHNSNTNVIIQQLPAMTSVTQVTGEKSLAVILARTTSAGFDGKEIATVAYQRYGKGKVMSVGATGLWQWAFLPGEMQEYDDIYERFWGQMVRWLVTGSDFLPGQDISFLVDKNTYTPGEMVHFSVSTKLVDQDTYEPWIDVAGPDGNKILLVPDAQQDDKNIYFSLFEPEIEGEYKAILHNNVGLPETEEVRFTVYQDSVESRYVSADREVLDKISSITGGEKLELDQLDKLPGRIKEFEKLLCEHVKARDVWDRMEVFLLIAGLLGTEWLVRRTSGLV